MFNESPKVRVATLFNIQHSLSRRALRTPRAIRTFLKADHNHGAPLIQHSTLNTQHSTFAFSNEPAMPTLKTATRALLAIALLAGLTAGGEGLWIYAKAKLAQLLLEI